MPISLFLQTRRSMLYNFFKSNSSSINKFYRDCQVLSIALNSIGLENVCLHGFMRQKERVAALGRFKSKIVRILIATDGISLHPLVFSCINFSPFSRQQRLGYSKRATCFKSSSSEISKRVCASSRPNGKSWKKWIGNFNF